MEQQADKPLALPPSRRLRSIQLISAINVYGLFFSLGIAAANISRLFPWGGAVYVVVLISVISLSLPNAKVDAGRVALLGISLSAIAFWDALIQFLVMPIYLRFWIIPLWQCLVYSVSCLMVLIGVLSLVMGGNSAKPQNRT